MPPGYRFDVPPNDVASFVLGKSTWAVLALTCHIELFSQAHYRASIADAEGLSDLFKDVFLFHWKEESQHAIIDELEWMREDAKLASDAERDAAVDDLIALVGGVDGILQAQAKADAAYFLAVEQAARRGRAGEPGRGRPCSRPIAGSTSSRARSSRASRTCSASWSATAQMARIQEALAPLTYAMPAPPKAELATAH